MHGSMWIYRLPFYKRNEIKEKKWKQNQKEMKLNNEKK